MDLVLQALLIGLLQGLTEFIPVSSSAHLELAPWIAGWRSGGVIGSLSFDVFLHLGTLLALLAISPRLAPAARRSGASTARRHIGAIPTGGWRATVVASVRPARIMGSLGKT